MMPALFLAHGSPINIVADNAFTRALREVPARIPRPVAILVISAHWQSRGSLVTSSPDPCQIYDFSGFPEELYEVKYEAPGNAALAAHIASSLPAECDPERGIDHGAWSVLHHMYPAADIPVLQLSLDAELSPRGHFELGGKLAFLRSEGVLVIGSGNIVHSFDEVDFDDDARPLPWAVEFDAMIRDRIDSGDTDTLVSLAETGSASGLAPRRAVRRAFRTNEHYLPMLYALALRQEKEPIVHLHESIQNASMGMRCFMVG